MKWVRITRVEIVCGPITAVATRVGANGACTVAVVVDEATTLRPCTRSKAAHSQHCPKQHVPFDVVVVLHVASAPSGTEYARYQHRIDLIFGSITANVRASLCVGFPGLTGRFCKFFCALTARWREHLRKMRCQAFADLRNYLQLELAWPLF